ncbi:unnamed protein product [Closterium sp. Yama58-4]|nr:unnamed protein product [Closterium sp. Yama58-4]
MGPVGARSLRRSGMAASLTWLPAPHCASFRRSVQPATGASASELRSPHAPHEPHLSLHFQSAPRARKIFSLRPRRPLPASRFTVRAIGGAGGPETFLSLEEAGLVELAGLDAHERFLARLTISSLNLLRVISEQEGVPIEELNAGRVCDWFIKDKAKREQDVNSAVLKWPKAPEW